MRAGCATHVHIEARSRRSQGGVRDVSYEEDEQQDGDTPQLIVEDEDVATGGGGGISGTASSED